MLVNEPEELRIGNLERDQALEVLGNHLRAGRLTPDEYSARSSRVLAAVTKSELAAQFADLPGGLTFQTAAEPQTNRPPSGYPAAAPSYPPSFAAEPDHFSASFSAAAAPLSTVGPTGSGLAPAGRNFDTRRLLAIAGPASLILFFVCGFLGGWSWSWLFFLVPGLIGSFVRRR